MFRHDQRSKRGDAISLHHQRYCYCCGLTLSTVVTSLVRVINLLLVVFVATQTESLFPVQIFVSALGWYQLTCLALQWTPEERANPYDGGRSLYEFTKSQYETIKLVAAFVVAVTMAVCLPYLVMYTEEPKWRHAGVGVLVFIIPAIMDYRVRRSLSYMLTCGMIPPETQKDEDDDYSYMGTTSPIDVALALKWMGKFVQMPVELGPSICYALAQQDLEGDEEPILMLWGEEVIWIVSIVMTVGLIAIGVLSHLRPGVCWVGTDGKVQIPVNASEAELSYAGYLAAHLDKGVVYVAAGNVAKDIPLLLRWISYSGLPEAGRWGEVLGHGDGETGAELRVEKCFGKSILYEYAGSIYIHLGDKVFEFSEGFLEPTTVSFALLAHATPVNGCWEII